MGTVEQPCYTIINVPTDSEPYNEMQLKMDLGEFLLKTYCFVTNKIKLKTVLLFLCDNVAINMQFRCHFDRYITLKCRFEVHNLNCQFGRRITYKCQFDRYITSAVGLADT